MKISIIYHSGYGHTKMVAEHIAKGLKMFCDDVDLLNTKEAIARLDKLKESDVLIFGSPTYFGNVSAEFKMFMESTGNIWYKQEWKNKFAAGFTNSSSRNGDKQNTLQALQAFASQHSMLWIPLGIMPQYDAQGMQTNSQNAMASYAGLMTQSSNSNEFYELMDLQTAEMFGQRIADVVLNLQATNAS